MYFRRSKLSTTYPPVNTNFNREFANDESSAVQCIDSLVYAPGDSPEIEIENQFYGFYGDAADKIFVQLNGVETGTKLEQHAAIGDKSYLIPTDTIIYGYSVSPYIINLWTDPQYVDKSQSVMYGQRGLYVNPYTDDIYDWQQANTTNYYALLHCYYKYGLYLLKGSNAQGPFVYLTLEYGNEPNTPITSKFTMKSKVISTGTVEQEILQLQNAVKTIEGQVNSIQNEVSTLVPNLTKLVSAEASKNYVSR